MDVDVTGDEYWTAIDNEELKHRCKFFEELGGRWPTSWCLNSGAWAWPARIRKCSEWGRLEFVSHQCYPGRLGRDHPLAVLPKVIHSLTSANPNSGSRQYLWEKCFEILQFSYVWGSDLENPWFGGQRYEEVSWYCWTCSPYIHIIQNEQYLREMFQNSTIFLCLVSK